MEYFLIIKTHSFEKVARFELNQSLKAIEYLKKLNSSNDYAKELFLNQKKIKSFNKFIEEFSLSQTYQIMRDFTLIRVVPKSKNDFANDKVEIHPKVSLV
jgi:hypothetical protein